MNLEIDVSYLTPEERITILEVLKRDEVIRNCDQTRVKRLRRKSESANTGKRQRLLTRIFTGEWFDQLTAPGRRAIKNVSAALQKVITVKTTTITTTEMIIRDRGEVRGDETTETERTVTMDGTPVTDINDADTDEIHARLNTVAYGRRAPGSTKGGGRESFFFPIGKQKNYFFFPIKSIQENFFFPVKSDVDEQDTKNDLYFPILIPSKSPVDPSRKYISRAEIDALMGNGHTGVKIETEISIDEKKKRDTPTPSKRSSSPSRGGFFGGLRNIFAVNTPHPPKQEEVAVAVEDTKIIVGKSAKPEVKAIAEIIQEEKMREPVIVKAGVKFQDDIVDQGPDEFQRKMDASVLVSEMMNLTTDKNQSGAHPSIIVSGPSQGAVAGVRQEAPIEKVIVKM